MALLDIKFTLSCIALVAHLKVDPLESDSAPPLFPTLLVVELPENVNHEYHNVIPPQFCP